MLGLDDHTYTHLSCRASKPNTFYIQPFGLKFSEITPECLLEVSHEGKILSGKELIYNPTAYQTHSALYQVVFSIFLNLIRFEITQKVLNHKYTRL